MHKHVHINLTSKIKYNSTVFSFDENATLNLLSYVSHYFIKIYM